MHASVVFDLFSGVILLVVVIVCVLMVTGVVVAVIVVVGVVVAVAVVAVMAVVVVVAVVGMRVVLVVVVVVVIAVLVVFHEEIIVHGSEGTHKFFSLSAASNPSSMNASNGAGSPSTVIETVYCCETFRTSSERCRFERFF